MRLSTFGGISIDGAPRALGGAATQRRPLALLALLAAAAERGVSREKLLALLWPESDTDHARNALRQTLYALRRDLGAPELVLGAAELRLNPAAVSSDLADFERALRAGDSESAMALYAGPFLDGFHVTDAPEFERWAQSERVRLAGEFARAVESLARAARDRGEHQRAAECWRRLAAHDPLNSRVAVELMRALADAGDRAGAIRHARIHEALLRQELEAAPDPTVAALAERLRAQAAPTTMEHGSTGPGYAPPMPARAPAAGAEAGSQASRPHARASRFRSRVAAVPVIVLAVAAVVVYAVRNGSDRRIDPTLVAVAPFQVYDQALGLWREGLMDILSHTLDGAGPLRTVAPSVAARQWRGGTHHASAEAFSRRTGAGIVISGYLMRAGTDSVRAVTSVVDAASSRVTEIELREAVGRIDRLTDSLSVAILRELGRWVPIGAVRRTSFARATSMEALKAFLRAEQFYRRTEWDSAQVWYEEAIAHDSTFALAFQRLGHVFGWQRRSGDSLAVAYKLRAGALNRGLGPRDSLLVLADSLDAAASEAPPFLEEWPFARRLFGVLNEALRRYPNDPAVWHAVGEARYHYGFGPVLGVPERATLDAFDRAIALDSAFAPAYVHTPELALNVGGPGLARRYIDAYLRLDAASRSDESTELLRYLLAPGGWRPAELARVLDTVPGDVLGAARTATRRWPDSAETALQLSRRLFSAPKPGRYGPIRSRAHRGMLLAGQLAFRGHVREAHRVIGDADWAITFHVAYFGGAPSDSIAARLGRLVARGSQYAPLATSWWGLRGDTASLRAFLADARRRAQWGEGTVARQIGAYDTAAVLAHLALARRDTGEALRRFLTLPDTVCARCYTDRLTRARLLSARGRYREVLTALEEPLIGLESPFEVLFAFERARAAERLGEREIAIQAYHFVVDAWQQGDPEVQPYVAEARRGLGRLTARRGSARARP